MISELQLIARTGHPDFLDLPWHLPLAEWGSERLVEVPRGIGRHVVRFVNYDQTVYALKELPRHLAEREYRLLRRLADESIPVVETVGLVIPSSPGPRHPRRASDENAVLITRHLDLSQPYRTLFTEPRSDLRDRLVDALAGLLVRLHLAGFSWGDCSLSNALFRRDAGALAAYLVDAETGELHPELSEGQRTYDLMVAEENVAGELLDIEAARDGAASEEPFELAAALRQRYECLWSELTREEVFGIDERYRIEARLRRLNEFGFDVAEVELLAAGDGYRLKLHPHVVEPGHHRRRLVLLTGLDVQENQARRLLNDIASFRAHLEQAEKEALPEAVVAHRWRSDVFEPTIAAIPEELRAGIEAAEAFHEILEHRWFLSEAAGRDVGLEAAVSSYIDNVLRARQSDSTDGTAATSKSLGPYPRSHEEAHHLDHTLPRTKRIAVVAHDNMKKDLLEWARFNRETLSRHHLYATGTTGTFLEEELKLEVVKLQSGPLGGDQEIGAMISRGELDFLVFFWDPLEPQPHDPDVKALLRMSVVWNIPVACNRSTADFMITSPLMSGEYRPLVPDYGPYRRRQVEEIRENAPESSSTLP